MKRIIDFLVIRHKVVLAFFIGVTILTAWLITQTTINSDMTKYLPADSPMKKGIGVMLEEFPDQSAFYVMIDGLSEADKAPVQAYIAGLEHVQGVAFEQDSARYNVGEHTLYVVQLDVAAATAEVKAVRKAIEEKYAAYTVTASGDALGNTVMELLPMLAGIALVILLIILFIMCNSWIEPILFLITIGVAVIINMGTNIVFESVSDITASIAAVLQLVLSMDYSIMLLNRYRQEKQLTDDANEAMKRALKNALVSISSSSITTIVGMLALVFMSFTIGKDMGFVLAKGVFLSLLCIFTVLPGLILVFRRAIEKTAKKSLHINMNALGRFSFWARRVIPVAFVVLFGISYLLRGNVGISYGMAPYYEINRIFNPVNNVAVLYENRDEPAIAAIAEALEADADVLAVNAYATTLGKAVSYAGFADIAGVDADVAAQMFVHYLDGQGRWPERKLAFGEFIRFIQEDIARDERFKSFFTGEDLQRLAAFSAVPEEMRLTADDFAAYSGMDATVAQQIYGFYFTMNPSDDADIAVSDLVQFLTEHAATNPMLAPYFTPETMAQLAAMGGDAAGAAQAMAELMAQEMTPAAIAQYAGMDEVMLKQLFAYYDVATGVLPQETIPLDEMLRYVLDDIVSNAQFQALIPDDMRGALEGAQASLDDGMAQLMGTKHSRMIIEFDLPEESEETFAFFANLEKCWMNS